MKPPRLHLVLLAAPVFLLCVGHLVRFFVGRTDIWWTPKPNAVPLADATERVEIYVRDAPLLEQVRAGRMQLSTDTGAAVLTASDLRLRFNNWDRVRAQKLPSLVGVAVGAGASGALLLLAIVGWLPGKPAGVFGDEPRGP